MSVFLEIGVDLHRTNPLGQTPLHIAAMRGNDETVSLLIKFGADVAARTEFGQTPLHMITNPTSWGQSDEAGHAGYRARLLIEAGADVDARTRVGQTPLYWAVKNQSESVAGILLEAGANPKATTFEGETALHVAAGQGWEQGARLLLDTCKGANVSATSNSGYTPLHFAAENVRQGMAKLLLDAGAEINAQSLDGKTPLFLAVQSDVYPEVDPTTTNPYCRCLAEGMSSNLVKMLLAVSADCTLVTGEGETAEDRAEDLSLKNVAAILRGAKEKKVKSHELRAIPPF